MYLVRKATRDDCPAMLELVHELAVYEQAPGEVTVSLEHFTESGFGEQPIWWAHVVEYEGRVVAMALYYLRFSTWKGQRMYLEDIIVTEEHRRKGIGTLLMEALIDDAQQRKLHGISWQVLDWNEPAINFYKKYNAFFDGGWLNAAIIF